MKKKILSLLVTLAMVMVLPMNAMAANTTQNLNEQDTEVDKPGTKGSTGYEAGNVQAAGASYGEATAGSSDGTAWTVENDDDGAAEDTPDANNKADISVWARISDASAKIYKIDIAWGSMKFEFNDGSGSWNVQTHTYDGSSGGDPHWVNNFDDTDEVSTYEVGTNGTNNRITVTNHSNSAVDAAFAYQMVNSSGQAGSGGTATTPFNDGGGVTTGVYGTDYGAGTASGYNQHGANDVIGYFYGSNDDAAKAHVAIAATYNAGTPTAASAWQYDNGSAYAAIGNQPTILARLSTVETTKVTNATTPSITLPTAEMIGNGSSGANAWGDGSKDASALVADLATWNSTPWANGQRSANVYFAFSGQPDKGQGAYLPVFTKVGVITVTITPNEIADYNKPAETP